MQGPAPSGDVSCGSRCTGELVIAERSNDSLGAQYDRNGEAVEAFGAKRFWRVLSVERGVGLGSTRHLES